MLGGYSKHEQLRRVDTGHRTGREYGRRKLKIGNMYGDEM